MTNIKDVANLAQVSVSTVSNILNNKNNVSIDAYNRVMAAMNKLNYNPNMLARNLRTNKLNFVGVILPDLSGHYIKIYEGINKMANRHGFHLILKITRHSRELEQTFLEEFVNLSVRGILLATCNEENTDFFDHILARSIPIIFIERYIDHKDYTCVRFEHEKLIFKLTGSLLAANPGRNITLIVGPSDCSSERDALNGFVAACNNRHVKLVPESIIHVTLNKEYAFREIMSVLGKTTPLPETYIVTNCLVGYSLLEILALFQCKAQVYLLTGDDWHDFRNVAGIIQIPQQAIEMGLQATDLLYKYIKSPMLFESRQITLPPCEYGSEVWPVINTKEKTTLQVLLMEGPTADALKSLLPNLAKTAGIDVQWRECRYLELYETILSECRGNSPRYDAFMIDLPWISSLVEENCLGNLSDFLEQDHDSFISNYSPMVFDKFNGHKGHIYTVPFMIGLQILFYRRDIFENQAIRWHFYEEYGIPLQPPKTWTEFNLIARYFTRSFNPQSPVAYGTCIAGQHPVTVIQEFLPRQWAFNGNSVLDNGEVVMNSIQNIKALQNLKDSFACSPPDSLEYFWDDQIHQFLRGEVAMINTYNSHILRIADKSWDQVISRVSYDDIPGNIPMLGGWALGINRHTKTPEQAYRFIKWACSDRLSVHNTLLGGLVPKTTVFRNNELMMSYPWFEKLQANLDKGRVGDLVRKRSGHLIDPFDLDKVMGEGMIEALLDRRGIQETLQDIGQKIQLLLA